MKGACRSRARGLCSWRGETWAGCTRGHALGSTAPADRRQLAGTSPHCPHPRTGAGGTRVAPPEAWARGVGPDARWGSTAADRGGAADFCGPHPSCARSRSASAASPATTALLPPAACRRSRAASDRDAAAIRALPWPAGEARQRNDEGRSVGVPSGGASGSAEDGGVDTGGCSRSSGTGCTGGRGGFGGSKLGGWPLWSAEGGIGEASMGAGQLGVPGEMPRVAGRVDARLPFAAGVRAGDAASGAWRGTGARRMATAARRASRRRARPTASEGPRPAPSVVMRWRRKAIARSLASARGVLPEWNRGTAAACSVVVMYKALPRSGVLFKFFLGRDAIWRAGVVLEGSERMLLGQAVDNRVDRW